MLSMSAPNLSLREVFEECISRNITRPNKISLQTYIPLLDGFENDYKQAGLRNQIHQVVRQNYSLDEGDILEKVYSSRFAKKESCGRHFYDQILITAPDNRCSLCGKREATELDHYLPKTSYANLSVLPINLIPVCHLCNKAKSTHEPSCYEDSLFHPYFDNLDSEDWLFSELNLTPIGTSIIPRINFSIVQDINGSLYQRLNNIFDKLNLNETWSFYYGQALIDIAKSLRANFFF